MSHNRGKPVYRATDNNSMRSTNANTRKGEKQKWYDDTSDHNVKYLGKIRDMKEQLQKDGQGATPSEVKGEHSRHRTHPLTRPGLTRHLSVNLPVFVTSADLSSVPRAGRLSMYSKVNKPVPAIHPVQGVGLLDDPSSRKGVKRTEHYAKRHNSLTPFDKISQDGDRGNQPPTLKRFARSQKPVQLSTRGKEEKCMHLRSYNLSCSHTHSLGRLRSRSTCSENEWGVPSHTTRQAFARVSTEKTDTRGAIAKGKTSGKYKPVRLKSEQEKARMVSLEVAPVKRSIMVDVPTGKTEADHYDPDSSGYKAPASTPLTVKSEKSDLSCPYCQGSDSGISVREGSSRKSQDTSDSDEWSDIGVTLSQIRLSHSQSEPSIKDIARVMISDELEDEGHPNRAQSATMASSRGSSDEMIPVLQINSRSEAENEEQMENTLTINAPFIMFRPATPRMPEREEKTYDHEVGRVLVKAATQAELRRKEMRRLMEDIEEFNSANQNLYRKVNPLTG